MAAPHWKKLEGGLPPIIQANLAIAPSNPKVIYATVAAGGAAAEAPRRSRSRRSAATWRTRRQHLVLQIDRRAAQHWILATEDPRVYRDGLDRAPPAGQPARWVASAAAISPPSRSIPKTKRSSIAARPFIWRTEDAGLTWSAVRGAPGGDDYQKSWVNPNNPNIILLVSDQGGVVSANRGESWSNWYTQPTAAMYHVTADNAFPYRLCSGQQDSGSACVDSRSMDGEITFHDWHPVGIEEYGEAAPDPKNPNLVYGGKVSVYNRMTGQKANVGPAGGGRGGAP